MRARCVHFLDTAKVLDATCGIGADALALAREGIFIVAGDRDERHAALARANLEHEGLPARVVVADAGCAPVRADVLVLDPDRRAGGGRDARPERWSPTFSRSLELCRRFRAACAKLPPAFDPALLADLELPYDLQWTSLGGELCEVTLWTGDAARAGGAREAVALGAAGGEARLLGEPEPCPPLDAEEAGRIAWLAEPDPAVIRSGLVGLLARQQGLRPVGPGIAYLGGPARPDSPLLAAWPVIASCSADPRRVRSLLQDHGIGPVTVKKRGHPDPSDVLARRFGGRGHRPGLIAVARLARGHGAWLLGPRVGDEGLEPPTSSL